MIPGRQFAAGQIQGSRPYQEDYFGFASTLHESDYRPSGLLMVLADGMGGHAGGDHASSVAVECFIETYEKGKGDEVERLEAGLKLANDKIRADIEADENLEGMGCTLVAVAFTEDGMVWVSVGDSPLWLYRDGKLRKLNADHSMAPLIAREVENGKMSAEEAAVHPQRNALRSALVGEEIPLVDLRETPLRLRDGDKIVLASDGVETLSHDELCSILSEELDAHRLSQNILKAVEAKARRGQDNATVMVVAPDVAIDRTPSASWSEV